ncbi:MAG: stage 0 sporulation family protein [Oscillospiraceae bacterium]|nr:stage 0 sporulation family protein [Oscillospiraceae bacterium]
MNETNTTSQKNKNKYYNNYNKNNKNKIPVIQTSSVTIPDSVTALNEIKEKIIGGIQSSKANKARQTKENPGIRETREPKKITEIKEVKEIREAPPPVQVKAPPPVQVKTPAPASVQIPETETDTGPKIEIVGVRFKPVGKIYFFSPGEDRYAANDKIIVETSRGLELGYIAIPNKKVSAGKVAQPLKHILRRASEEDAARAERNKKNAKDTIKIANDRIKFHNLGNLKMKLIEAEYTFDNSKLIYYFTADGRVDFRDLVKDLAAIFKTRIEMRQIGIRDQTKAVGGLSICGRPFCCNSFLQDFAQVTIKMAKEQNLSINSSKISGACGRLMCCLKYEHEAYDHLSKDTPKINSIVEVSTGETGVVTESNLLTGICKVKINHKAADAGEIAVKPFPKKNLKIIGFMKNEQEHLYDKK